MDLVTFAEAREIVRQQLLPRAPRGLQLVVRDTGLESPGAWRVFVDSADGDDLIDPPVITVSKLTGHVTVLGWTAILGDWSNWTPCSDAGSTS